MLHIDVFTYGNEFKDSQGQIYKITSNIPYKKSIQLELQLVEAEPTNKKLAELIKEE